MMQFVSCSTCVGIIPIAIINYYVMGHCSKYMHV